LYDTVIDGKLNQDLFKFSKKEAERSSKKNKARRK
jgi:hypothetical protein